MSQQFILWTKSGSTLTDDQKLPSLIKLVCQDTRITVIAWSGENQALVNMDQDLVDELRATYPALGISLNQIYELLEHSNLAL